MKKNYSLFDSKKENSTATTWNRKLKNAILFLFFLASCSIQAQEADCLSAAVICGNTQSFNPSGIGTKLEQLACGGIEHNSTWVAFQAKASGKLNFVIRPFTPNGLPSASDFDWSLFALAGAPGIANCDAKTQLSCNFSGTATVFGIPGATGLASPNYVSNAFNPGVDVVAGNWYVIIIDQFSNSTPLLFNIQFTGNPESPFLNSSPGIFDNTPDFNSTGSGCSGTYNFTSTSTATGGIASYAWDFGDGSTATGAAPSHTYITSGTYYVTLAVTDNNGCKSYIRKQLVYNANTPPTVNLAGIFLTPSCSNSNNGTITITTTGATTPGVTGGTPPYTYELISPSPSIRASQSSNTFTGLQPGGYTIKVTDACGKSAINTATIAQVATNSNIGLSIQNIQSSCGNTATGSVTLFANGTTPPYTMALIDSSPVLVSALPAVQRDPVTGNYYTTFNNLLPGVYTVQAVDGCGKIRSATLTLSASTAPTATAVASASCAGTPTGTLNVTATAATGLSANGSPGSFQYALIAPSPITRPFQNGSVFENLVPGTYTIAVKDSCGNIGTSTTAVTTANAPSFGTAFSTPSCPNGATGTIEAQISTAGGGSPYTFELIAPSPVLRPAQANNDFSGLPPGIYTVRLTDACGAQVTGSVTVSAASAPTFTTTTGASCINPENGTITITPGITNIGPFTFELISPGAAIRAPQGSNIANTPNSIFTGLQQGTYTIRMTDGCGVPVTNTVTIAAPTGLVFPTGSTSSPSCSAGSTGQITVAQPTTGSTPYSYEIIAPSPITVASQNSRIFNNLPAGNYTVRITDACGTQAIIGAPITVAAATAPGLSVTNTSSCATNTGTITCLATTTNQGGGSYQYALVAPSAVTRPNQTSPIFTGLPTGSYTVQITDQCGATGNTTTAITAAGAFTPAAGGSVVSCNGSGYNAQIIVTSPQNFTTGGPILSGSGGGPYTYSLYDATNTTLLAGPQSDNIFSTVIPAAGTPTHTVRVTDICGNTSIATITINSPIALGNAVISATTSSCSASNTGVIKVTTQATGGIAPYTYTLIDAVTAAVVAGPHTALTFNAVPAKATGYFIRSTDACGNSITSTSALLFPAAATPTLTTATVASCGSSSTGKITATPGVGATLAGGTFSYYLYDAANTALLSGPQASPVFNNLAAATYTVRITDRCGNVGIATATVASGAGAPTASGTATGSCSSGNSGVITAASTGGSLPVTYTLVNQVTSSVIAGPQASNIFTGLAIGTYIVRVTDACGTVTNSADVAINNLTVLPTITTSTAIDCDGSAILAGFGGGGNGGPYTYALCSGPSCTSFGSYAITSTFTVTSNGTYRISVQDRCGNAISSSDIVINLPTRPQITTVNPVALCGASTVIPVFTGIANTPYYSVDNANFSPTLGVMAPGTHTISVADYSAGNFGCASEVFTFTITPVTIGTTTVSACGTYTWAANGTTYTASGTYTSVTGCHTETLVLTITPSTSNSTTAVACDSYTWAENGQTYTTSGTYTSVTGCHTETLVLTITPSTSNSTTAAACDSYTWAENGQTYTTSGTYTSVTGCHTETLVLTITPSTSNSTTAAACDSYTWAENGQTYTTSGTYTSVTGCHTETLVLTITPSTSNSTTAAACDSYTWAENGTTYTASGTYTSVTGCHTETLVLTITPSTSNSTTAAACDSYTWAENGTTYTASGTYTSVTGCHTETLVLTINTTADTPTGSATQTVTANIAPEATIADLVIDNPINMLWYGSLADALAGINTLPLTTVLADGLTYYSVNVAATCPSTPFAVTVTVVLKTEGFDDTNLTYYPNPTNGKITIKYDHVISQISMMNLLGQTLMDKKTNATDLQIDLSNLPAGTYLIKIASEGKSKVFKVIRKE